MDIYEYFNACKGMNKANACPDQCELKYFPSIPPIWIPLPQKPNRLLGLIISRDATTKFIQPYNDAQLFDPVKWRQDLFQSDAIPRWFSRRIEVFNQKYMQYALSEQELKKIKENLCNCVYWTHLHKCCTDKRGENSLPFRKKNAKCCADQWLRYEIEFISNENIEFIITLGKDVEQWFEKAYKDSAIFNTIRFYSFPHLSRANMASWYPKDEHSRSELQNKIRSLLWHF